MQVSLLLLAAAYVIDLLVGDPPRLPHPVVWMGKFISRLDRLLQRVPQQKAAQRLAGCLFPLLLVSLVYGLSWGLIYGAHQLSPWLGWALEAWLISTTIAVKGLAEAGRGVYEALRAGNLPLARQRLSYIVGRDTQELDASEIARGGIETVAENIVDAVTAPLFWAFLGGAPLALAYRAVNTLDSMVGYKNDKYIHLGWASARLDDLANYVPARLTLPFLILTAFILKYNGRRTWDIARRDARVHPSPNSGYAEAAVAGALGIRLGGCNTYHGVTSFRAYMGDKEREIETEDIVRTTRMLYGSTALYLVFGLALGQLLA